MGCSSERLRFKWRSGARLAFRDPAKRGQAPIDVMDPFVSTTTSRSAIHQNRVTRSSEALAKDVERAVCVPAVSFLVGGAGQTSPRSDHTSYRDRYARVVQEM
jgi:hypothetical protein